MAEVVAASTGSVHLSIDEVEESTLACGLPRGWPLGVAAFEATRAMAEQNLRLGHDVIVDAVNDGEEARQTWRTPASRTGAHHAFVSLVSPTYRSMSEGSTTGIAALSSSASRPGRTSSVGALTSPRGPIGLGM